jgi:hypothetical protein
MKISLRNSIPFRRDALGILPLDSVLSFPLTALSLIRYSDAEYRSKEAFSSYPLWSGTMFLLDYTLGKWELNSPSNCLQHQLANGKADLLRSQFVRRRLIKQRLEGVVVVFVQ